MHYTILKRFKSKKAVQFFDDYSSLISEVKYRTCHGEGIKASTPKQVVQRLPIVLARVKARNTS